ncbi:MAG: FGGY-family carbohydrate kinase [Corynebacterium sp.]|nr:FGGY-family carbohydrate kinase [Corynebacterium sp.]
MFVLAYDLGTTGVKTCLYSIDERVQQVGEASESYPLAILPGGGAEQDPNEWWAAMCRTTRALLGAFPDEMRQLAGISFCAQTQAMVLVDDHAHPVHPAFSYMDQRATAQMRSLGGGFPRIAGLGARTLFTALRLTGAAPASVKDPVWKYHWLRENAPDEFARGHKWLDAKETLIARMTGEFVMSQDSAFATMLYDIHSGTATDTPRFHPEMLKLLHVDPAHMPRIVRSTDVVGPLQPNPAAELGLPAGIPVYAGGGDASLIGIGAGAAGVGNTHAYWGTSGWVGTVTAKQTVDVTHNIAAIVGAEPGLYTFFAELETAGKCFEWVKEHLAEDEVNVYLNQRNIADSTETAYSSLYDYLSEVIAGAEPGAGGVIFTPWLHGNRMPFEDPLARASFFNISLDTGKTELLRAVIEGVCYHLRWFTEISAKKVGVSRRVRFVGGGALSPMTAQILADVLGKPVDVPADPKDVGAVGAALLVAVGEGLIPDFEHAGDLITVEHSYEPNPATREVYDRQYRVFTQLYKQNKSLFAALNGGVQ